MKKFKIISYIILLIVLVVLALTVYTSATQINEEDEKEKVTSEIQYLDTKLVDLFNNMNNIQTRNYKIYTTNIEESGSTENSGEGNRSSEKGQSEAGGKSSEGGSRETSTSDDSSNDTQNQGESYEMKPIGILTSDRDIDWTSCKNELELIYTSISTITLDLYHLNVVQEDILNFNKALDDLTVSLEEENKQVVLNNLVNIYEYIPKFAKSVVEDTLYKTIVETKLNIFKAYAKLDTGDWSAISTNITDAITIYTSLLTNTQVSTNKQTSINKAYVMLNELKNVVDTKNSSVFLIKYKNLLEVINNM